MAGEADAERLVVLLEARIRDFEKNMQKASGTAERSYGKMRRDSRSATVQMEQDMIRSTSRINQALAAASLKIGAYGKAFVGGLVAGGAVAAVSRLSDGVRTATANVAKLGDQAKIAGVSLKGLQELRFIGERNRIDLDAMIDGLKEMNLRADEFVVTGKGSAADAFRRMGYDAADLGKKLKQPMELFTELIGRMRQFDRAAQIRLADEIFGGTGGERFVQLIGEGEEGIRRMRQEAHELGQVLDDEVVEKARELDAIFRNAADTISTYLHGAAVRLADDLYSIVEAFQDLESHRTTSLEERLVEIGRERLELENEILRIRKEAEITDTAKDLGFSEDAEATEAEIRRITEALKKRADEEQRILEILRERKEEEVTVLPPITVTPEDTSADFLRKFREELSLTADQRRLNAETQRILNDAQRQGAQLTQEQAEALAREVMERDRVEAASKRGLQLLKDRTDAAREYLATIREFEADLLFERQQISRSPVEQRVYAEIRDLGLDINSIEGQRIADNIRINELLYEQRDVVEELAGALKGAASSFLKDLFTGRDILESLVRIGDRFASMNFDALVENVTKGWFGGFGSAMPKGQMVSFAKVIGLEVAGAVGKSIDEYMSRAGPGAGFGSQSYTSAIHAGRALGQTIVPAMTKGFNPLASAITKAADQLGISARDLATVISYETGGTFSTSIRGGAGNRHIGLIQFGPTEQRMYGAAIGQALEDQMAAVVRYLQDRGLQPGMGLLDLYSTINAGRPGLYNRSDDGGLTDIYGHIAKMQSHQAKADQVLAGVPDAVRIGSREGAARGVENGVVRLGDMPASATTGSGWGQAAFGLLGAALGGFGTGYQSANPLMGALGGGLQGLGAGMQLASAFPALAAGLPIIGAVVGGIAGVCAGSFGNSKKDKQCVSDQRIPAASPCAADDGCQPIHAGRGRDRVRPESRGPANAELRRRMPRAAANDASDRFGDPLSGGELRCLLAA